MEPGDLHREVEGAFNAGDVAGLMALYEPDAVMVGPDGSPIEGQEAIGALWSSMMVPGGHLSLRTVYAVEWGDTALLRNNWTFTAEGVELGSSTAEVARRQPDGNWRYVIDNPFGAAVTPEP
jgi:ketosteroid isomerase-like protein